MRQVSLRILNGKVMMKPIIRCGSGSRTYQRTDIQEIRGQNPGFIILNQVVIIV